MNSIIQKRECFSVNLRRQKKEEIFKLSRRPIVSKESMLQLMRNSDQESLDKLLEISTGSKEITQNLIDLGGVQYFYDSLKRGKVEEAILGLGNLCSVKQGLQEIMDLDIIDLMFEEVHKYQTNEQLIHRLWFLGILAKFESESYELQQQRWINLFQVFTKYQEMYPNILRIQEECFYGFYFIVSISDIQFDLMQKCLENLNKGLDNIIVRILYHLVSDNIKLIKAIHKSQFISQCHLHLQITKRQRHTLFILFYYAQYYVENILQNDELVKQIKYILTTSQNKRHAQRLLYIMLHRSPTALLMRIINQFQIIEYLKDQLTQIDLDEQVLLIIVQLKLINKELIQELIPYLEKLAFDKKTSHELYNKIQGILN